MTPPLLRTQKPALKQTASTRALLLGAETHVDRIGDSDAAAAAVDALRSVLHPNWPLDHADVEEAFRNGYRPGVHSTAAALAGLHALRNAPSGELVQKLEQSGMEYDFTYPGAERPRTVVDRAISGLSAHLGTAEVRKA